MALNQVLDEREQRILDFLVRDYIKTVEPISSSRIREGLKLKESPATIRNIVANLDEAGFFEQPHISAGRMPTDAAYRYFVDYLMSRAEPSHDLFSRMRLVSQRENIAGRIFSETLNLLSLSSLDGERFSGHGLSHLLKEPEFKESEVVRNAGYLMDNIDEIADVYFRQARENLEIFIGEENPVECAHDFGVFYLKSKSRGRVDTMLLVGPKRMDYENISRCIHYYLEEF